MVLISDSLEFERRYALFEGGDLRTNFLHDADSLVAENHVGSLVVYICTTKAGVSDFEEDLIRLETVFVGCRLDDIPVVGAFENSDIDTCHGVCSSYEVID
jgi:hypothetical protein